MIFAVFKAKVIVKQSASIELDPRVLQISPVPSVGATTKDQAEISACYDMREGVTQGAELCKGVKTTKKQ